MQLPLDLQPQRVATHVASTYPAPPHPAPRDPVLVFVRHPRARRYVIRITDEGAVRVTVPRWGSKRAGAAFAESQRGWIARQLERFAHEGRLASEAPQEAHDERRARERALTIRAKQELPPRLMELAARFGLTVTRISIRNQKWRWGSCSRGGHICLNWRLVAMPEEVRDYVLIHELMHLKRMDHSPAFWKLVGAACPEYKKARAWLRSHGAR